MDQFDTHNQVVKLYHLPKTVLASNVSFALHVPTIIHDRVPIFPEHGVKQKDIKAAYLDLKSAIGELTVSDRKIVAAAWPPSGTVTSTTKTTHLNW